MANASEVAEKAERDDIRSRWLLSAPALLIVFLAAVGPLLIVVVYSFLTPGNYGDVKWQFSIDAWVNVLLERDVFDDTLSLAGAHLLIFWRSVSLSALTTILTLIFGFPTAYFIATRPEGRREIWLFLITIPFWTNLLIRTFAVEEVLRNDGIINSTLQLLGITDHPVQLLYTNFAVLLGMVYVFLPLMVLPLYASMEKIDFRLVEAAYDLYATRFQVLRRIIIPLVKPGVVAGSILVFIPSLGAYVTPRVLGGGTNLMIGNLIELQFGQGRNWPLGAALSISLMAIVMVALLVYVRNTTRLDGDHG
ncbi:ABC transporter permease [Mesorhizobium sp. CU2]|uniref:ABC transporter permease n=1 Tax=unclassified Mesorhizobium TaxID=325217 RepID=UPI00112B8F3C|nr:MULTISPECIES: ABC transporter permease [unclassified Mesorhizobium]TPN74899.1 ABC transporter permease [Mesorhizobium sp. CU3]TPO02157.1 ABC transporter permease [Mesorhizobium sp. CU2]